MSTMRARRRPLWKPKVIIAAAESAGEAWSYKGVHEQWTMDARCWRDFRHLERTAARQIREAARPVFTLTVGGFEDWLPVVLVRLDSLGLSRVAKYDMPPHVVCSGTLSTNWIRDDVRAINIIVDHVDPALLRHLPYCLPATTRQLLHQLGRFGGPFRFLDLPRELRDEVYSIMLTERARFWPLHKCWRPPRFLNPASRNKHALVLTCRQVRLEATTIFYQTNKFGIYLETWFPEDRDPDPFTFIRDWVEVTDAEAIASLRHLRVTIQWHKGIFDFIEVNYDADKGLTVHLDGEMYVERHKPPKLVEDDYVRSINELGQAEGWKGERIVAWFTQSPGRAHTTCCGPPYKHVRDTGDFDLDIEECDPDDPDAVWWRW